MIEVDQLTKTFGQFVAVNKLSFNVQPGEVLGFLGPNGAGKSTTMKMISGFLKPTSGSVTICGHNIAHEPIEVKKILGYLPEGAPLYREMLVRDFLKFITNVRQIDASESKRAIEKVVEMLALGSVINRPVDTLSKGFSRRVGLAQAILHDPKVLILDEPTDGLDPNQKHQVRELIRNLSEEKMVIVSTHILEEVSAVCSRAMIVSEGEIKIDGSPQDLEAQSKYHGAVNLKLTTSFGKEAFQNLGAASHVESLDNEGKHYMIFPEGDGDSLLAKVHQLVAEKDLKVDSLFVEKGRLEEVFRSVTIGGNKDTGHSNAA